MHGFHLIAEQLADFYVNIKKTELFRSPIWHADDLTDSNKQETVLDIFGAWEIHIVTSG